MFYALMRQEKGLVYHYSFTCHPILLNRDNFILLLHTISPMLPDYPHKIFADRCNAYACLMEALATDSSL